MMDLVAPLVAPALSQKPAFVTYFVARGAPRPCYIPEGFDSLPYFGNVCKHECFESAADLINANKSTGLFLHNTGHQAR